MIIETAMRNDKRPLVILLMGPTASGKTDLAMALHERLGAELISVDSAMVYRGMDIGTAKPTAADRVEVPHHLLDVVTPDQPFSVAEFQRLALQAIADIHARDKLPIMVGGTGLYVDAVLYDFAFRAPADPAERERLSGMSVPELQAELSARGIALPASDLNPRHLIRALETGGAPAMRQPLRPHTLLLGLRADRNVLNARIADRARQMFEHGLEQEVAGLVQKYGWDAEAMKSVGYREFRLYFEGAATMDDVRARIIISTQAYAKRQRTWFKRNPDIQWIASFTEASQMVDSFLNNKQ